jgi:HlyD family secretion protein
MAYQLQLFWQCRIVRRLAFPLLAVAIGCHRAPSSVPTGEAAASTSSRRVVALGRLEPAGGVVSISAVPGERLQKFADGVVEGATVAAGAELARVSSFDLRQTQLDAASIKLDMAKKQRDQQIATAQAQVEQAEAAKAQAEAKYQETFSQQQQLDNLREAAAIAADDLKELEQLRKSDPELVTEQQMRRRRNASDRATTEYQTAAATLPAAQNAAAKAVEAAEANVKLAGQNLEMAQKVDQTLAAEMERKAAEEALDQSILSVPKVEGGSTEFRVLRIMMQPGEFVAQIPILEIGDVSKMVAIAEVYEADAKEIVPGQSATIRSPAFAGKYADGALGSEGGIRGKVTRVGTVVASPNLTNRNPLAPSDRSVVEVVVAIDPADKDATAEAARRIGLQVTVEFGEKPASSANAK